MERGGRRGPATLLQAHSGALERAALEPETISVVVPVSRRSDDLVELHRAFSDELRSAGEKFEFVFVFDGDASSPPPELRERARKNEDVRLLAVAMAFGETATLRAAIEHSRGDVIVSLPAYFQVSPDAISDALEALRSGADLVVVRRSPGSDGRIHRLAHRLFHFLVRATAGVRFRDMDCGLRVMRRDVASSIPLYGSAHRFLPVIADRAGYRVEEIEAPQHALEAARPPKKPEAYFETLMDLLAFLFVARFTDRPLRFFGWIGSVLSAGGVLIGGYLLWERFVAGQGIANRPLLLLSVLLVAVGVQVFGMGLMGEIIVSLQVGKRRRYRIRKLV